MYWILLLVEHLLYPVSNFHAFVVSKRWELSQERDRRNEPMQPLFGDNAAHALVEELRLPPGIVQIDDPDSGSTEFVKFEVDELDGETYLARPNSRIPQSLAGPIEITSPKVDPLDDPNYRVDFSDDAGAPLFAETGARSELERPGIHERWSTGMTGWVDVVPQYEPMDRFFPRGHRPMARYAG